MNEQTLRQLIEGGESGTVEFKIKAPRPAELAERMCGMANTHTGGVIIFGVADMDQQIVGLKDPNQSIDLALRAARMVKPPISITDTSIRTWRLDSGTIITLTIEPNSGTLYQYNGACLIRRGTHTVPLCRGDQRALAGVRARSLGEQLRATCDT
jgi:ATP-dependent DNA helicase RecG